MQDSFSKEWLFLEQCIALFTGVTTAEDVQVLLVDADLDWGDVLHQALRHRVLPLLAHILRQHGLLQAAPGDIQDALLDALLFNRQVLEAGYHELAVVTQALHNENIPFAVTKGYALDPLVYGGLRIRKTSDIDLLVAPSNKHKVSSILAQLDYSAGYFDRAAEAIVEVSEQSKRFYELLPEYMPEFVKRYPASAVQSVCVDIACSLTWFNSSYKIPVEHALADLVSINVDASKKIAFPSLNLEYQILYTALHLFKEAWVEFYGIKDGNDVTLSKFLDVYLLISHHLDHIDRSKLASLIDEYNLAKPILWVLKHTERVFNCSLCDALGLAAPVAESWLASWQTRSYNLSYWKGSMRARLQQKDRRELFLT